MTDDAAVGVDRDMATLDAVRRQRIGVRTAVDGLERAVAAPSAGRAKEWGATVRERAQALREAFNHHVVVTEGPTGLFEEVVSQAPRLANQVARLREDHLAIADALVALVAGGSHGDPGANVVELRDRAVDVIGRLFKHRHHGSSLLYEAYFVDIDAAD